MNSLIITVCLILSCDLILADECNNFTTCGACISSELSCAWCSTENHYGARCRSNTLSSWCEQSVYNPQSKFKILPLSNKKMVQLKPQKVAIKARPGYSKTIPFSFKPILKYPLDIYYLMDYTYTMKRFKETLIEQAKSIHKELTKLSNNVHFGVGSFIEKDVMPYTDPKKHYAYAFKNHLSLTDEIDHFISVIKNTKLGANQDDPEAGLDALMQVMACTDIINWRNDSRRIIVYSSDGPYHSAGDGKIVGTWKPNDMKCYLKDNSYDEESHIYDYPSVGQINKIASEKKISIIFAADKAVKQAYVELSKKVEGSKHVELSDKSDIPKLISNEYKTLSQELVLTREYVPSHINLTLEPSCTRDKPCKVPFEGSVDVTAHITLLSCPKDQFEHVIKIEPVGLNEKIEIFVELECQCECEKNSHVNDSIECNRNGAYQCGVCKCNDNRYGKQCECIGTSTEELDLAKCKARDSNELCSGRGVCSCGQCTDCGEDYYGTYCEYGFSECPTYKGKLCGNHGRCVNNTCSCNDGWTGNDCICNTAKYMCIGPNSKECSGNGVCECSTCQCTKRDTKNNLYFGEFCNNCDDCRAQRCKELEDYAECNFDKEKKVCDEKVPLGVDSSVKKLNNKAIKDEKWRDWNWCSKSYDDGSSILFKYLDKQNSTSLLIQIDKELPPEANVWIPVAISIGVILFIGLLTVLAWKILTNIIDEREYKKFVKDASLHNDSISQNPLYQSPATFVHNPAYSGNISG